MSKRCAGIAALAGMMAGAYAGSPYLSGSTCADAGSTYVGCALNREIAPFICAIAIGGIVAIALVQIVTTLALRLNAPPPRREPPPAVELGDSALELASWGRAPGRERSDAPARASRLTPSGRPLSPR